MSILIDTDVDVVEVVENTAVAARNRTDGARFRTMFEDHFDRVCVALRRFCVPTREIEDAAQQVFVVA
jgi:hypothetical protein